MQYRLTLMQSLPHEAPTALVIFYGYENTNKEWPVAVRGTDQDPAILVVEGSQDLLDQTGVTSRALHASYGRNVVKIGILTVAPAEHDIIGRVAAEGSSMPETGDPLPWILYTMRRNAPILSFHPDEKYLTYNVPDYLQNVQLYGSRGTLLAQPPLTPQNLPMGSASAGTYLNIPADRQWIEAGDLQKTKIYAHALKWSHDVFSGVDFQYFFFYPYNGKGFISIRFPGIPENDIEIPAGAHQGDWESIIVRTDTDGNVIGIYCNQHGSGQWYLPGQLQWQGGHPIIYVARSGHPSFDSVGHFPTHGGDFTFKFFGLTVGVQLDNVTGRGRQLPTADLAELVATSYFDGTQVREPWWLNYLGRFGQVVFADKDKEETSAILAGVLGVAMPSPIARRFADAITAQIFSILGDIEPDGPEAPKAKGWWNTIRDDGPWANVSRSWSGNQKISSLPGHIDPRSRDNLALAPFGDALCLAFRGESSNQLYEAWYDGSSWRGNTPIRTASGSLPLSTHGPALATYGGRLHMAFKAENSNVLYLAWFDGTRWQGNTPINTDHGIAESTSAPALATYEGQLYLAFKGAGSNGIYLCRYDGGPWRGNTLLQTDHGVPASTGSPALAVYNGALYMTFKGETSDELYMARFNGGQWRGNTPITTDHGAALSPITPWMAPLADELMMLFKGSDSDYIYLAGLLGTAWVGNERLSRTTPISPLTNVPGAIALLGDELVMVFKGADSNRLYQANCKKSAGSQQVLVIPRPPREILRLESGGLVTA
jgi:hypothetical protein